MSTRQRFRPLDLGQILDSAFRLYRDNFLLFLGIFSITQLPSYSLRLLFVWELKNHELRGLEGYLGMMIPLSLLLSILFLLGYLTQGAIIYAAYQRLLGNPTTLSSSYRVALRNILPILFCGSFIFTLSLLGTVFYIVPGILLFLLFSLAIPVIVLEKIHYFQAMGRSSSLIKGLLAKAFLLFLVLSIINLVGWINLILLKDLGIGALHSFFDVDVSLIKALPFQSSILLYLGLLLLGPLKPIAVTLLYIDAKVRVEGFDLKRQLESIVGHE